jgi:hypothetical protein
MGKPWFLMPHPGLVDLQRVEQIEHRAAPPGQLSDEDYVDTAGLR